MRLHRFYINQPIGDEKKLEIENEQLVHQLYNVFRYKVGQEIIVFDGSGNDYLSKIIKISKKGVELEIIEVKKGLIQKRKIVICFSIIKKDLSELIVGKATELGVSEIFPFISERSEKKALNTERLGRIVIESAEQSGWSVLPKIHAISNMSEVLEMNKNKQLIVLDGKATNFIDEYAENNNEVVLLIGPEGGFSEKEIELAKSFNAKIARFGKNTGDFQLESVYSTLRAETAVISAISKFI